MLIQAIYNTLRDVLRKRYLVWFKKGYVRNSIGRRKGSCRACGICCRRSFPFCVFLTAHNKCRLVLWFGRAPKYCAIFPIDGFDQELFNLQGICGFYWESEK